MSIRRLVIASLIAGAASAQAGNIPAPASQPAQVVSGWTTGNGIDVLGSGVLQGNLNLVAGVAHSANASLTDILYGKVAGNVQQVDGQTKLLFQRGIEADYMLASGHGIVAALAGTGKSVVADAYGAIISDGMTKAPGMTGGGSSSNSSGSGSSGSNSSGSGSSGSGSTGSGSGSASSGGGSSNTPASGTGGSSSGNSPSASQGNTSGQLPGQGNGNGIGNGALNGNGSGIGTGNGAGIGNVGNNQVRASEVPEPSSIALMLLGMVGAGAITRRRR